MPSDNIVSLNTRYVKTAIGVHEVSTRALGLSPLLRRLLILVDGKHSGRELATFVAGHPVVDLLSELLARQCIEVVGGATAPVTATMPVSAVVPLSAAVPLSAPMPIQKSTPVHTLTPGQTSAQVHVTPPVSATPPTRPSALTQTSAPVEAFAPVAAAAPTQPELRPPVDAALAALPPPESRSALELAMARNFMIKTINTELDPHLRTSLVKAVGDSNTAAELRQVYPLWLSALTASDAAQSLPTLKEKLFRVL